MKEERFQAEIDEVRAAFPRLTIGPEDSGKFTATGEVFNLVLWPPMNGYPFWLVVIKDKRDREAFSKNGTVGARLLPLVRATLAEFLSFADAVRKATATDAQEQG